MTNTANKPWDLKDRKVTKVCPECDKSFTIRLSVSERYIFCCQACKTKYREKQEAKDAAVILANRDKLTRAALAKLMGMSEGHLRKRLTKLIKAGIIVPREGLVKRKAAEPKKPRPSRAKVKLSKPTTYKEPKKVENKFETRVETEPMKSVRVNAKTVLRIPVTRDSQEAINKWHKIHSK